MGFSLRRNVLLPSTLLLSLSSAARVATEARGSGSNTTIAPISFAPDGLWDGIDGAWSSFKLQVGTPVQAVRTFVSWVSYQTWVVLPQGCSTATDVSSCTNARGGTFTPANSSTWDRIGIYYLGVEDDLGYNGDGIFGYDTVQLGSAGIALQNTTVGAFAVQDYYLGIFGLNPQPTNFTSLNAPSTSYMSLLKNEQHIPSLSFGYTAGAIYRDSGVFGSLTLGGYDSSKIVENDLEFVLSAGVSHQTVVALKSISTESQVASSAAPIEMLPGAVYVNLDATVSQIWLPAQACAAFEREFGLQYDSTTDLYLVNDTQHAALLQRNPNVTFQITGNVDDKQSISISLPYAAFDLTALPPYQGLTVSTTYFPLRRATDPTQYTLGRTFFQEAYISVDFEGQVFNVSQVNWNSTSPQNIVTIPPGDFASTKGTNHGLSAGELAGIVTGIIALVVLLGLFFLWLHRHRTLAREKQNVATEEGDQDQNEKNPKESSERPAVEQVNVYPKSDPNTEELALPPAIPRARKPTGSASPGKRSSVGRPSPLAQAHDVMESESFPTSVLYDSRNSSFETENRPPRLSALAMASMPPRTRSFRKPPTTQAPAVAATTRVSREEQRVSKEQPRESTDLTRDLTALPRSSRNAALPIDTVPPQTKTVQQPPSTEAPNDTTPTRAGREEQRVSKEQPRESADLGRDLTALPHTTRDTRTVTQSRVHWVEPESAESESSSEESSEDEQQVSEEPPPAIPPFAFEFDLQNEGRPF